MSNFTIEELKRVLAWEEPKLEEFYENGAYDERSFEYQKGLYVNRQEYGKELLEALQTIEALQAKIDAALAIEPPKGNKTLMRQSPYYEGSIKGKQQMCAAYHIVLLSDDAK